MLTIWGRTTSSNVQLVMWAVGELGLAHERIDAGHVYGGLDTEDYGAMNPNRLVPTLRDGDGPAIWESAACLRYLAGALRRRGVLARGTRSARGAGHVGGVDEDELRAGARHQGVLADGAHPAGEARPGHDPLRREPR